MGKGSENELPKEVFAALPKDPDQQLEVAQQITQIVVSGRVAKLEADCVSLRKKEAEKNAIIGGLQARVVEAETTLAKTRARLAVTLEGQARMIEEKDVLADQVKKLTSQVAKLEEFKKALMQSLDISTDGGDDVGDESKTASSSPALPSPASPRPRARPFESRPPLPMSKSMEPPTPTTRKHQGPLSCTTRSKCPAGDSDGSSGASEDGKSPRIDVKEFFRQARNRLTCEQFSEVLNNVKELNACRREEERKAALFATNTKFHPKVYSCNTHAPPDCGDWVLTSSKVVS